MSTNHGRGPGAFRVWQFIGVGVLAAVVGTMVVIALQPVTPPSAGESAYHPAPPDTIVPKALFIGDSYAAGVGATSPTLRWTTLVSNKMGWLEDNKALGGTGYVATSGKDGCGREFCPAYEETILTARADKPDIVVISGGRNDGPPASNYQAVIESTIRTAKTVWTGAEIIVTSPVWDDDVAPATFATTKAAVAAAAVAAGATLIDLGEPLAGSSDFVTSDGVHPSDAGHAAIAAAFLAALA